MGGLKLAATNCSRHAGDQRTLHLGSWCLESGGRTQSALQVYAPDNVSVEEKLRLSTEASIVVQKIFPELTSGLNQYHGVSHSERYWRIILERWLHGFVDVVLQRTRLIEDVLSKYDIEGSDHCDLTTSQLVADCTQDYLPQLLSQQWNCALFGEILRMKKVNQDTHEQGKTWQPDIERKQQESPTRNLASFVQGWLGHRSSIAISDSYLKGRHLAYLMWMTKSVQLRVNRELIRSHDFDESGRDHLLSTKAGKDGSLEAIVRTLLPNHVPRSVLESYERLSDHATWKNYPVNPRLVFTANTIHSSDHYAIWTAEVVESGAELVIAQHGGLYGESIIRSRHEEYEVSIADRYLTWGWDDGRHSKIRQIPSLTNIGRRKRSTFGRTRKDVVVVTDATSRFSRYAWDTSSDRSRYINSIREILPGLIERLHEPIIVRLHHGNNRYDVDNRCHYADIPSVVFDDGSASIAKLVNRARLVVVTTLGTTFGECVCRGIPTIICVDPLIYPVRSEFEHLFERLHDVGIFHTTTASLMKQLDLIGSEIEDWWESHSVQSALMEFGNNFFKASKRPVREILAALEFVK